MTYSVKECFLSLQGEGLQAGRVAVFCRFAGCNLSCSFCDTDFVGFDGPGGGRFAEPQALAERIEQTWSQHTREREARLVVFTGGEPLLQLDDALVEACHARSFMVAVETNGTLPCPSAVDWICVSPKAADGLVLREGNELKLVYPQPGVEPAAFESMRFAHFLLQPMDGPERDANTRRCIDWCLAHPKWRLSIQQHKVLGIR